MKELCEQFPHLWRAILAHTLVIKVINLSNFGRVMVASDESYALWVSHFVAQEEAECLN